MTQYLFRDDKGLYEYQLYTQKKLSLNHLMPSERNQLLSNEETKIITGHSFNPTSNQELILDADGNYTHNTFKRFKPTHNNDQNITNFLELMLRLFPDSRDYNQVLQFIAHMIQKPEQRPSYGLLLTSESGTGKGVLYDKVISPLLAYQSIKVNKYSRLFERFSTVLFNNLLCWLDDPPKSKHDTMQAFRGLTSDPTVTIELKGGDTFTIKTITRLILASNERTPLILTKDDLRRWYAPRFITHKVDQRETQEFISSIINQLDISAIYNYLSKLDLSDFNPFLVAPTDTLKEMIGASKLPLQEEIEDYLENHNVFKFNALKQFLGGFTADRDITNILQSLDYTNSRVSVGGTQHRVWHLKTLSKEDIKEYISEDPFTFS